MNVDGIDVTIRLRDPIAPQLVAALRQGIAELKLRPGEALSEKDIAARFGVSRQPVREAFIKLSEAGLLVSHWPEEFGGRGASAWEHFIIGEQLWEAGEPRGPQYYNVNWIGPTILHFGTPAQKEYHLGRMRQGDVIWCQGFSEPSGGSDLGSLRTKAVHDGFKAASPNDKSVINGWFSPVNVTVSGYSGQVIGGDVIWTAFNP